MVRSVFEELDLLNWVGNQIGRYQIESEIGRGGMGVVYLADDAQLGRKVAIKVLSRARRRDARWSRRFWREARTASALNHPNIMTVYELGDDSGIPFIACEFVDGETIRSLLSKTQLSVAQVVELAYQIAQGMATAHSAGVIHRDLKADNVMVRQDGLVKILDFGLAKDVESNSAPVTKSGAIAGTVHFMSPEQARGQELSTATDVFSYGVLLYQMTTGQLPFLGETNSDVIVSLLQTIPRAIFRSRSHQRLCP